MDRIRLNEMVFYGYHGVLPEEQTLGQRFIVDLEIQTDLREAGASDDLAQTLNYAEVFRVVESIVTGPPFRLIEAVAERVAEAVLIDFAQAATVLVSVRKLSPPIPGAMIGSSEVQIERSR
jgi:dihydroneopterin aldolase